MTTARILFLIVLAAGLVAGTASAMTSAFTYQGKLTDSAGTPADGIYDMQFSLWDAVTSGSQVGTTKTLNDVQVNNGLFTVELDLGGKAFPGDDRWLETAVKQDADPAYTTLTPRVTICSVPYALYSAAPWITRTDHLFYDGNVGLNVLDPLAKLHLLGTTDVGLTSASICNDDIIIEDGEAVLGLYSTSSGNYSSAIMLGEVDAGVLGTKWSIYRTTAPVGGELRFSYGASNQYQSNPTILSLDGPNNRVGVGNTDPATTLDVSGIVRSRSGGFRFPDGTTQTTAAVDIGSSGVDNAFVRWDGATALQSSAVYQTDAGYVGIGTSAPTSKLQMRGGDFQMLSAVGALKMDIQISETLNNGYINTYGSNGQFNVGLRSLEGYPYHGYVGVYDGAGVCEAGMYVNSSGNGAIFADTKSFRRPNPRKAGTEIVYVCPESPEAAVYLRGTARLVNGRALVPIPEHFQDVAVEKGMTVQLTPCSADSKGLAVVHKKLSGFEVRELGGGTGSYEFDWRVEAVRQGYEDFQVIQSDLEGKPAKDKKDK